MGISLLLRKKEVNTLDQGFLNVEFNIVKSCLIYRLITFYKEHIYIIMNF